MDSLGINNKVSDSGLRRAIIVGASSGIGRALAGELVAAGYLVGITGRREKLLNELKAKKPGGYFIKVFDVREAANIPRYLDELVADLGGLDLLIISAGTGFPNDNLDYLTEEKVIRTNVNGFTSAAAWAYNYFKVQGRGHLAAISSVAGLRGLRQSPSYSATKAYQINYLESLRQKAGQSKLALTVTDIRPGFVATAMAQGDNIFWVASPETAARQIFHILKKRKKVAYVTRRWRLAALILKIIPRWFYDRF